MRQLAPGGSNDLCNRLNCQLQHASLAASGHLKPYPGASAWAGEVHDLQLDLGPAGRVDLSLQYEPLSEELLEGLAGRVRGTTNQFAGMSLPSVVCMHAADVLCSVCSGSMLVIRLGGTAAALWSCFGSRGVRWSVADSSGRLHHRRSAR